MSKILNLTVDMMVYESASATNDPADADKIKMTVTEAAITQFTRPRIQIANATVDQAIVLPANTVTYLMVFVDQIVTMKINGDAGKILRPTAAGKKTPVLLMRGDITSLTVSNSSGSVAELDIIAAK